MTLSIRHLAQLLLGMERHPGTASAGGFGSFHGQVYDDGFAAVADYHALALIVGGVNFLVWDIGRHIDEVAGCGFFRKFEMVAPAHPHASADDVEYGLKLSMMVRTGLRLGLNHDRP